MNRCGTCGFEGEPDTYIPHDCYWVFKERGKQAMTNSVPSEATRAGAGDQEGPTLYSPDRAAKMNADAMGHYVHISDYDKLRSALRASVSAPPVETTTGNWAERYGRLMLSATVRNARVLLGRLSGENAEVLARLLSDLEELAALRQAEARPNAVDSHDIVRFSQTDMDRQTKPLHVEIERLRARQAEAEAEGRQDGLARSPDTKEDQ